MKKTNLLHATLTHPLTRQRLSYLVFGLGTILMMALVLKPLDLPANAEEVSRELQISQLREQQIEAERQLLIVQDRWKEQELNRAEAQRILDEETALLNAIATEGDNLRNIIDESDKEIIRIRDGKEGLTQDQQ